MLVTARAFRLFPLVLLVAVLLAAAGPARAQLQLGDEFIVSDVEVDVTADTAAAARDQAFLEGQRLALGRLVARLANLSGPWDTSGLSDEEISAMIQGFQVDSETAGAGRYQASLTYIFQPEPIRRLVGTRTLAPAEPVAGPVQRQPIATGPVVVLPVYGGAQGERLWDSPNPWRSAWLDLDPDTTAAEIIVPFGDLQDVATVTVQQATGGDSGALRAIAAQYGADETVVAIAEPTGGDALSVILNRYGSYGSIPPVLVSVPGGDAGAPDFDAAVARAVEIIGNQPAAAQPTAVAPDGSVPAPTAIGPTSGPLSSIVALVPLRVQADWFQTLRRLRGNPGIAAVDVISLSAAEAIVELSFYGGPEDLRLALTRQGLRLDLDGTTPVLRRAEDPTAQP